MAAFFVSMVMVVIYIALAASGVSLVKKSPIDPLPSIWSPTPKAEGIFAPNSVLLGLEKMGVGQLPGPEDLAVDSEGWLYTGCADGWIKRVWPADGVVEDWVYVGGHPLGLVVGLHGELLVCEPALGLLNVTKEKVTVLSNEAEGLKYRLADGVDVAKDGVIYFTDASFKFGMAQSHLDVLESRPNGRLLKYDPATGSTTVLLRHLYFPNGVALSGDQTFLVFCETSKVRCQRYWLQGPRKGSSEVYIDNLPGYPDNIKYNGHGKFWVGLVSTRTWASDKLLRLRFMKHILASGKLGVVGRMMDASARKARVLGVRERVGGGGEVVEMYEDPRGEAIAFVTVALEVGRYLYMGGLASDYVARIKMLP